MSKNKTYSQELLEKIRTGELNAPSRKRRRIANIILLVDIILVVAMMFYFNNRKPSSGYLTAMVEFQAIESRFSIQRDKDQGKHHFSLSLKNRGEKESRIPFNRNVATLTIKLASTPVLTRPLGEGVTHLDLKAGDSKYYVTSLDDTTLMTIARENPDHIKKFKRTLFRFTKDHLPLTAHVSFNTAGDVSVSLPFEFEVEK